MSDVKYERMLLLGLVETPRMDTAREICIVLAGLWWPTFVECCQAPVLAI